MWIIRKKYVASEFYHAFPNNLVILDQYFLRVWKGIIFMWNFTSTLFLTMSTFHKPLNSKKGFYILILCAKVLFLCGIEHLLLWQMFSFYEPLQPKKRFLQSFVCVCVLSLFVDIISFEKVIRVKCALVQFIRT